jgi:hypothetical protein
MEPSTMTLLGACEGDIHDAPAWKRQVKELINHDLMKYLCDIAGTRKWQEEDNGESPRLTAFVSAVLRYYDFLEEFAEILGREVDEIHQLAQITHSLTHKKINEKPNVWRYMHTALKHEFSWPDNTDSPESPSIAACAEYTKYLSGRLADMKAQPGQNELNTLIEQCAADHKDRKMDPLITRSMDRKIVKNIKAGVIHVPYKR